MKLIEVYKCLCDETRLRILHLLSHRPLCVCHFQEVLGAPQVKISKHLAYLREHALVETQREGTWIVYSLPAGLLPRERGLHRRSAEDDQSSGELHRAAGGLLPTQNESKKGPFEALNCRSMITRVFSMAGLVNWSATLPKGQGRLQKRQYPASAAHAIQAE
jgi:ArsR family transcriptional regulator